MKHELNIEVQDMFFDSRYIKVRDWSTYSKDVELTNRVLKFIIPGIDHAVLAPLPKNDSLIYNSKILKIAKKVEDLPDGLWEVTYSVCPNEKIFTKVYHFRTTALSRKVYYMLASHMDISVNKINIEIQNIFVQVVLKLKALRGNVIDNYNVTKAYELYQDIENTLEEINNKIRQE